jgi:hypothetical protein
VNTMITEELTSKLENLQEVVNEVESFSALYGSNNTVGWLLNHFKENGRVLPLEIWLLTRSTYIRKNQLEGLYALYVEKPHVKTQWVTDKSFVYVGITKNMNQRWLNHEPWVRKVFLSQEHWPNNANWPRSKFYFCFYSCFLEEARKIESECWANADELGLKRLKELQQL